MSRRILFIVEGEVTEPRFLKKILGCYGIAEEHQVFSYNTNIHVLYEMLFSGNDEESLDLLTTLKETASEEDIPTLSERYSDIYLVFDAEVQDSKWDPDHIRRMLRYFDNSTENGLLLLNYPMFESIRHMSSLGDPGYLRSSVTLEQTRTYKRLVGTEGCLELLNPNKYDRRIIDVLLRMNIWKLGVLLNMSGEEPDYAVYNACSLRRLFDVQDSSITETGRTFVINTSVMVVLEFINPNLLNEVR